MPNQRLRSACFAFRESLDRALDMIECQPDFFPSAAVAESSFCASLAVWEAVTLGNGESAHWRRIWSDACRKLHHGTEGLSLADLPKTEPCSWRQDFAASADIAKA